MPTIDHNKEQNLKGQRDHHGGSINIPMDIRVLATTISITRKGM